MRRGLLKALRVRLCVDLPVFRQGKALIGQHRVICRGYLADIAENAAAHPLRRAYQHDVRNAALVYHRSYLRVLQQRLYLAGEHYTVPGMAVEQRLYAYPVPCKEKPAPAAVPYRKRKYTVEQLYALVAVFRVGSQHHLGIRMPGKLHAAPHKPKPKLLRIVKLPVVHQRVTAVTHGLRAVIRVNDRKTAVYKICVIVNIHPRGVRSPGSYSLAHLRHHRAHLPHVFMVSYLTCNTAHGNISFH